MARGALADRLREARERNGWTQTQVADWSGIEGGAPVISRWEAGSQIPNSDNLRKLATGLRVSADWLLGIEGAA